jgi:hypothetical protein
MLSWTEVEVRQMEHERRSHEIEQNYWMHSEIEVKPVSIDRWQWRIRNAIGGWLVTIGCRLQTHVETTRQVVYPPQAVLDGASPSVRPCP